MSERRTLELRRLRERRESDDLLEVARIRGVIYVHPTDGSVSTAPGRTKY
jgi:hypothetical protein